MQALKKRELLVYWKKGQSLCGHTTQFALRCVGTPHNSPFTVWAHHTIRPSLPAFFSFTALSSSLERQGKKKKKRLFYSSQFGNKMATRRVCLCQRGRHSPVSQPLPVHRYGRLLEAARGPNKGRVSSDDKNRVCSRETRFQRERTFKNLNHPMRE